ncbi:hypothetical protein CspeluHIS016_0201930 [Cutaneotrichosporon spelunceum]|uniref:Uncharacterized protein n=1 Tax=Cutaneotrichosporon spelunceum TaxID=1672016 RepID=A0AAD3TRG6_9TREE|nr:hypothetical protein CspeluHIS016_0201930 [Cutaneotrichosporon spelunceum]
MLDLTYFPHLLESIFNNAGHETLLTFRASSKAYKQRADERLFTHVALLPRVDGGRSRSYLSGSLCTVSSTPQPTSPAPLTSATLPIPIPGGANLARAVPDLSASSGSTPPASRPLTPVYSRLPLGPSGTQDSLALTRVLDLPIDDAVRGEDLQPLLWSLERGRARLEIVRNVGSRVPPCTLPRTHTFVDFAIPWKTYLFRLGQSMFPPETQRAVLHAGGTMHPAAAQGALGTVLEVMARSEMPRSLNAVTVVVGLCEGSPDAIVEYGQLLCKLAQCVIVRQYSLEIVGIECVLKIPEVDSQHRDVCTQIAAHLAPYFEGSTGAKVTDVLSHITYTSMGRWMARPGETARLESRFDL